MENKKNDDYMGNIDMDAVIKYSLSQYKGGAIHGLRHWKNVEQNGLRIAELNPEVNKRIVRLFAYLHDHQRTWDGYDSDHGPRAAEALIDIASTLLWDLSEGEFETLSRACRIHTKRDSSTGNPTIDTCLDADRLDLGRCGITPDPDRMLTEEGKRLAED